MLGICVLGICVLGICWDANDLHSNPMPNAKLQRPDAKLLLRLIPLWLIRLF